MCPWTVLWTLGVIFALGLARPAVGVSDEQCFEFQEHWDKHFPDYYNMPFPPEARQCWDAGAYQLTITEKNDRLDFIDQHDDFVRIYIGIKTCEDPEDYKRVLRVYEHLNAITCDLLYGFHHRNEIDSDLDALTPRDYVRVLIAAAKYSDDFGRYIFLLRKSPEIFYFFKYVAPKRVRERLEELKEIFEW